MTTFTTMSLAWAPAGAPYYETSIIPALRDVRALGCLRSWSNERYGLAESKRMVDDMRDRGIVVAFEVPCDFSRLLAPALAFAFAVDAHEPDVLADDYVIELGIERFERLANDDR